MNVYIGSNRRLPVEYQEVEYIQSSGTQRIATGVNTGMNIGFDIDFKLLDTINGTGHSVFGGRYKAGQQEICLSSYYVYAGGVIAYGTQNKNPKIVTGTRQQCSMRNGVFTDCDGVSSSFTLSSFSSPAELQIFCLRDITLSTQYSDYSSVALYSLKLYDGDTLVRYFIPCYRKSDSVIGLYDLVNNQFYTNSGTGTFSKGNDVTMAELKNDYIGEVYEYSYYFKGKTTSQIQSDGWTLLTGTLQVDSNGITGSSSQDVRLAYSIPSLANAKKIILTGTIVSKGNSNSATSFYIGYGAGRGISRCGGDLQGSTYNGIRVIYIDNNGYAGNTVGNVSATTYNPTITIDLENKTVTQVLSGFSNSVLTLTDSQVANIRNNYNQLIAYNSLALGSISNISITIK